MLKVPSMSFDAWMADFSDRTVSGQNQYGRRSLLLLLEQTPLNIESAPQVRPRALPPSGATLVELSPPARTCCEPELFGPRPPPTERSANPSWRQLGQKDDPWPPSPCAGDLQGLQRTDRRSELSRPFDSRDRITLIECRNRPLFASMVLFPPFLLFPRPSTKPGRLPLPLANGMAASIRMQRLGRRSVPARRRRRWGLLLTSDPSGPSARS